MGSTMYTEVSNVRDYGFSWPSYHPETDDNAGSSHKLAELESLPLAGGQRRTRYWHMFTPSNESLRLAIPEVDQPSYREVVAMIIQPCNRESTDNSSEA